MAISPTQYPQLIAAPMLQDYFVDKDLGTPLAGGIVTFYQDNSRTTLKNVYYQTGSPGAYSYIPLNNPCTLTAVGTFADPGGNDVIPFFYPYDEATGTIAQPYYITVQSSGNIPQFTRENFPFVETISSQTTAELIPNLISNGQFAAHNNLPNSTGTYPNGNVSAVPNIYPTSSSSFIVAPGGATGWYFATNSTATDTNTINFVAQNSVNSQLTGNPAYVINVACTNANGSATFKELRYRFADVNRFASLDALYTFALSALNNLVGTVPLSLNLIKYYGTGAATPPAETEIASFSVPPPSRSGWNIEDISFAFGVANATGPNNDSYVELAIGFPVGVGATFNVSLTNILLTPGDIIITSYPELPDNDVFATAIAGSLPTPDPNGGSLYLPLVYTGAGLTFDSSSIGKPYASDSQTLAKTELLLDGSSYLYSSYDSRTSIPYSRLGNYYLANGYSQTVSGNTYKIPQYGTGAGFVTAVNTSNTTGANTWLYISSNSFGTSTAVADGASPSGFIIPAAGTTSTASQTTGLGASARAQTTAGVLSGITLRSVTRNISSSSTSISGNFTALSGHAVTGLTITILENLSGYPPAGSGTPLVGSLTTFPSTLSLYTGNGFQWISPVSGGSFFVYYLLNGAGTVPSGTGTGVPVQLVTGDTVPDIIYKTLIAIQGGFLSTIAATSTANPGGYFTFSAGGTTYAVWFNIGGNTPAPAVSATLIPVVLPTGALTAIQVAFATAQAINSYSFAVPNFRGMTLRGLDTAAGFWDADVLTRVSHGNNLLGGVLPGTLEFDLIAAHDHTLPVSGVPGSGGAAGTIAGNQTNSFTDGGAETRPVNISVNWVIKY